MSIKLTGRLMVAALLSLTAAGCQGEDAQTPEGDSLSTQEAKVEQCVQGFNGIKNCATGGAALTRTAKGISVSGLKDVKADGFSSQFPRAKDWELQADIGGLGVTKQGFTLAARDGDQVVSALRLGMVDGDRVVLTPTFTGASGPSAYRVNLYQNGRLMLSHQHPWDYGVNSDWYNIHIRLTPIRIGFSNHTSFGTQDPISSGACLWAFRGAPGAFTLDAGGKPVSGDQLEIVEEVADGHYPYTGFSAIDVKAAASDFTVLGESTVPAK
ncbi:hypothetical protein D7V97_04515 [Corallococcus sp. CA053C]|uniref:hypothetical protein n=1 Tax=Corallococcus sp. CA053C TaxID=2316732 RepID=UPI000EA3E24E|nr:hypothetical protein [Corallococcus sp. CA053C]RKH13844.1 hypothetical protein D7V97_04515 [Corallococcus sp. CA053C]